ncbi:uncharacterized protein LOC117107534 [Anneissia japonica]|uniref:uncharacterized protein LOC117107534 n=1 Tax=Anneissia japonica TaxID=1529436 RepID=UPI001425502A|nr:uncharacterized protein LOC117107534 [Anneissia japonica]
MQSADWYAKFVFLFLAVVVSPSQRRSWQVPVQQHYSSKNGNIRLSNGQREGEGRLEIFYGGSWGTVCDDGFGIEDATVVCRQLGYDGPYQNNPVSTFGEGTGHINLDNLQCTGVESRIAECSHNGWRNHDCGHGEDVGVICLVHHHEITSLIRLVGGSSANKGRVELWSGYNWIPIVKSSWTASEAKVTCRQLGFVDGVLSYGSSNGYTEARYGQSQSENCFGGAQCSGWEPTLSDCSGHSISYNCRHYYDVSVECNPNRQIFECHCLTSSECNDTTGICPDGKCSVGWAGDYCQIELPRLPEPPQIIFEELSLRNSTNPLVRWDNFEDDFNYTGGPVVGYSIHYVDTSQVGYQEVLIDDVETTSYRLNNLPQGRNYNIGISCLIKTGSVTSRGPLSPTMNFTTPTEHTRLDFVLLNFNPMIDFDDAESSLKIGGYAIGEDRTNNINFGRRLDSVPGVDEKELGWLDDGVLQTNDTMFPVQSTVSQRLLYEFTALLLELPANISVENIGAFYSWATIGLLSSNISTFTVSKEANVRSTSTTIVAGVGERVELETEIERNTNVDILRWRHNGGEIISNWNGKTKVIIESVRTKDGGVYECYFDGERELGLQSFTQLIVRGCPSPKWGAECDKDCPVCYNGGVCHPNTRDCVCRPGYMGDECSEPCGDNNWGRSCSSMCSTSNRGCDGILFCLPEPMGCSCMAGYKGHDCKELCPYGTFGADCRSTCHCKFSACDRSMGCWNITCDDGFEGPQCQEYEDSTPCPNGFYGTLCQYKCHCFLTEKCYKNGTCPLGCQEGWGGDDCQFPIPALRNPPRISKSNFHSLHIEWDKWRVHHDYGLGNVTGYRLFYRYITPSPGAQREGEYTLKTKLILSQINPCRRYEIYIRAYRNVSGELVGGRPSPTVYHDMACNYGSVEVTIMAQPAAVDIGNKTEDLKIAVYTGALSTNILLGRTCDTGVGNTGRPVSWFDGSPFPGSHVLPTMAFPMNTLIETIVKYNYHSLVAKIPGESFKAKGGAFSTEIRGTWALPSKSAIVVLDRDANPMPITRSIVVGTGDRAVLSVVVEGNATGLRWRKNGEGIKQWKDKKAVFIEHVRTEDSGIYECFFPAKRNQGKHAIIQLNVKDCPLSKYGPACDLDCPVCYNGGVCDSVTSLCICPSGFTGSDCSVVCKSGFWGQDCSLNCNNEENGCLGNLFCPATPLGCSCLPGFQGSDCKDVCRDGFYGPDCKQVCNCPLSHCDPVFGCAPGSCYPGYGGPQCQEHNGNVSCTNSTFGPLCNRHCHCKNSDTCHDNGTCKDGVCGNGWAGRDCQIALPYLAYGPTLSVSKNRREIFVSWFDWTFGRDFGTGPVVLYEIFYKDAINGNYTTGGTTETTGFLLNKLRPGKQYNVAIKCLKYVDGHLVPGPASSFTAVSTCRLADL